MAAAEAVSDSGSTTPVDGEWVTAGVSYTTTDLDLADTYDIAFNFNGVTVNLTGLTDGAGLSTTMPMLRRRDQAGSQDTAGDPNGLLTEDRRPGSLRCHKAAIDRYPLMAVRRSHGRPLSGELM